MDADIKGNPCPDGNTRTHTHTHTRTHRREQSFSHQQQSSVVPLGFHSRLHEESLSDVDIKINRNQTNLHTNRLRLHYKLYCPCSSFPSPDTSTHAPPPGSLHSDTEEQRIKAHLRHERNACVQSGVASEPVWQRLAKPSTPTFSDN